MMSNRATEPQPREMVEEKLTPEEFARSQERRSRFERNIAWYEAHAMEIAEQQRGKYICVAGGELFTADSPQDAVAAARAAHPHDRGAFYTAYVTPNRGPKINAI